MKTKYLFALLCFAWAGALMAQGKVSGKIPSVPKLQPAPYLKTAVLPNEQFLPELEDTNPIVSPAVSYRQEEKVGTTTWDAQTYGCMPSRIYADNNGNPVATWLFGTDVNTPATFSERGTARNVRGTSGWPNVTSRIENVRTGFPAAARLGDGTEIIVSHVTLPSGLLAVHVARKEPGQTTWSESNLALPQGVGSLWPRVAVGGFDKNTVHVIAISTPTANGGTLYQGVVNGQLFYWRSTDGGLNWDKSQVVIPGLDSSKVKTLQADSYTIDANGETVGVAIFPDWNDLLLFKSLDNGDNWEKIVVNDFPDALENYAGAAGDIYTIDDIGYVDENAPDSAKLAVFSSDGFGSLLIDDATQAHVFFGRMYYIDTDTAAGTFYYPGMNGLCYWKETFGEDILIITGALDYNGDTALSITGGINAIGPYYNSLSSFPTVGTDENGTIYLAYSALHELYRSSWSVEKDQYYRHLYVMKSLDNGDSWTAPYELTVPAYVQEDIIPFIESVYPAIPRHIEGDKVWVLYQQDGLPGTDIWGDNHAPGENSMQFIEVSVDSIVSVFNPPSPDLSFDLSLAPNPVSSVAQLSATFKGNSPALVEVFDLTGKLVQQYRLPQNGTGRQTLTLPVQYLQNGTYSVRVTQGGRFGIAKLVKI
ncbi:MAG: hypothetical protein OHK0019_01450 [Saprospiraceae bacterium]